MMIPGSAVKCFRRWLCRRFGHRWEETEVRQGLMMSYSVVECSRCGERESRRYPPVHYQCRCSDAVIREAP